MEKREQILRPISYLPMISDLTYGELEEAENMLSYMLEAKERPSSLDDHTIDRVIRLYSEKIDMVPVYKAQLEYWKNDKSNSSHFTAIDDLYTKTEDLYEISMEILGLAKEISKHTIDKIMAMSDEELAIRTLTGEIKRPS
ncbi:MAG: hypothetical protein ISS11_08490 [Candidatus Marinimicrobia bacterium]|nr:hypothetical protein [Candidatus Neomarinimicrobiota bacterium]